MDGGSGSIDIFLSGSKTRGFVTYRRSQSRNGGAGCNRSDPDLFGSAFLISIIRVI